MVNRGTSAKSREDRANMLVMLEYNIHPMNLAEKQESSPVFFRKSHRLQKCGHKYIRPASEDDPRPKCIACKTICPWRARSAHMPRPEGNRILITPLQMTQGDIFDDDGWGMQYKGMFVMKVTTGPSGLVTIKMHRDGREVKELQIHQHDLAWVRPNG